MAVENEVQGGFDEINPLDKALEKVCDHPSLGEDRFIHALGADHTLFPRIGKCVLIVRNCGRYFLYPAEPGTFLTEPVPENWSELYQKARRYKPDGSYPVENELQGGVDEDRHLQEALEMVYEQPRAGEERFIHTLSPNHTGFPRIGKCVLISWHSGAYFLNPIEPGAFLTEPVPDNWWDLYERARGYGLSRGCWDAHPNLRPDDWAEFLEPQSVEQ
jgi:hypothetical protein